MLLEGNEQKTALLVAIIDSSEDAIISKNLNSRITSWNKSAERMFGYTEEEMIGNEINVLIPEELAGEEEMIISNLKAGKKIERHETIRITRSGKKLQVSVTTSPVRNSKNVVVGASTIIHDITRQKQNEQLIGEYAQRLTLINSISKVISAHLDVSTILQKVTDVTTEISGAAFGAFFYNTINAKGEAYMLYTLSGAPREAFEKLGMPRNTDIFKTTFSGDAIVRSDDIRKDPRYGKNYPHHGMPKGHLPVVSYLAVPVTSQSGTVIGGLFFGHPEPARFNEDHEYLVSAIASQAAIALDNAKLYEEIRVLNNRKDDFIGFAGHELKTPLTTLKGFIQMAKKGSPLSDAIIDNMAKQVSRLNTIIDELLNLSRIRTGRMYLNFSKTSLKNLVEESINTVQPANHLINIEMPVEEIELCVDAKKIEQVLINVLSNAVKYSPAGSTINVSAILLGDEIKISVQDEGPGIPAQDIHRIFNQFYRVSNTRDREGLGLGLYISKEIMEGHSGKIWVESKEGAGSTFYIIFPVSKI
jgi:PAS domain S-box-containing protein